MRLSRSAFDDLRSRFKPSTCPIGLFRGEPLLATKPGARKQEEFHGVWLDQRHRILDIEHRLTGTLDTPRF